MLVLAASDKGGTGRSVTTTNLGFHLARDGRSVCYADFDFGSPTAGAVFSIDPLDRGTRSGSGLHAYFRGDVSEPEQYDVWTAAERRSLRSRRAGAGRFVLLPGDAGGGEFRIDEAMVGRCRTLFVRLTEEFDVVLVDLSAGRSYATQLVLTVTGRDPTLAAASRWLVFHRWTRQNVLAAHGLVHDEQGLLDTAVKLGHDREQMLDRIRFVRTAFIDPNSPDQSGLRPPQLTWLRERNQELNELAARLGLGRAMRLGTVPLDPLLQWQEQIITENDLHARQVANPPTEQALSALAGRLYDDAAWEPS